jgi:hypothetical protein
MGISMRAPVTGSTISNVTRRVRTNMVATRPGRSNLAGILISYSPRILVFGGATTSVARSQPLSAPPGYHRLLPRRPSPRPRTPPRSPSRATPRSLDPPNRQNPIAPHHPRKPACARTARPKTSSLGMTGEVTTLVPRGEPLPTPRPLRQDLPASSIPEPPLPVATRQATTFSSTRGASTRSRETLHLSSELVLSIRTTTRRSAAGFEGARSTTETHVSCNALFGSISCRWRALLRTSQRALAQ